MKSSPGVVSIAVLLASCGSGDNSAARSFYATVRPGMSLHDAIVGAEQAQKVDVHLSIKGQDCPGRHVEIGRDPGMLHIRITNPQPASTLSSEPGYSEVGYSTREEFLRGLTETLPSYYLCKRFLFRFGRDQVWPTADTFTVGIDATGQVESVSELKEEKTVVWDDAFEQPDAPDERAPSATPPARR